MEKIILKSIVPFLAIILCVTSLHAQNYSLQAMKNLALEKNKALNEAKLEYDASVSVKKNAFTKYFPTVSASVMSMESKDDMVQVNMPDMPISLMDKMTVGNLMLTQPIFAGGRIIYGNKLADLSKEVNRDQMNLKQNEVLKTVEEKYWQICTLNEKMKTLLSYEKMLSDLYKEASDANKAGLILRNDLLKISLKQNEVQLSKLQLNNGIELARKALNQYVGLPMDTKIVLTDTIGVSENPESIYTDKDTALTTRIEYKLLQKKLNSEKYQTILKRGEFLPTVAVGVAGYRLKMLDEYQNNSLAFANVSIPISDWWAGSYTLQERKAKERKAQTEVAENVEMLTLQIEKNWDDLNVAFQQIALAESAVQQAQENVKINNDNYHSGTINISDMLEAQALLQATKDRLVETKSAYRIATIEYLQNTGRYN